MTPTFIRFACPTMRRCARLGHPRPVKPSGPLPIIGPKGQFVPCLGRKSGPGQNDRPPPWAHNLRAGLGDDPRHYRESSQPARAGPAAALAPVATATGGGNTCGPPGPAPRPLGGTGAGDAPGAAEFERSSRARPPRKPRSLAPPSALVFRVQFEGLVIHVVAALGLPRKR